MESEQKRIVEAAKQYVRDLYASEPVIDLSLEEIYEEGPGKRWFVTLSIARRSSQNDLIASLGGTLRRSVKRVELNEKGEPIALRDREKVS